MKVSWSWLGGLVALPDEPRAVARKLTFAGLEVESVVELGAAFSGVVVAEILARRPHPRSQKLTLVTVSDGAGTAEVVCGAPNVPEVGKVLWARPGSRLPDGRTIAMREVAGEPSPGMLCSEVELGLGADAGGILLLAGEDAAAAPGTEAQDALALRDFVLDVNVPANRPDCLGHLGIAREIAAQYRLRARSPEAVLEEGAGLAAEIVGVRIDDPDACSRYTARVIEGVAWGPAPRWMRRRLEAVGMRPISNLVDVTNYVMMELGHPLHAFDLDKLRGGIHVRLARSGERIVTLDGQERELDPADVLICDDSGPIALGGVMGGAATEVTAATRRILLEAATFAPVAIRRTSRRLTLPSEAAYRFERGVDAAGVPFASQRAAALLAQTAGGKAAGGLHDDYPRPVRPLRLHLRPERARAVLGLTLDAAEIGRCLGALELDVAPEEDGRLAVTVPTVRSDLEREVDLIEEVARIHGFADIPGTLPPAREAPRASGDPRAERARDLLAAAGMDEAQTFAFTSRARVAALRFGDRHIVAQPITILNPMRPEQEVLRTSLMPNLLAALAHNLAFGIDSCRLYEVGTVFLRVAGPAIEEPTFVGGVLCGARAGWLKPDGDLDFYDAKGMVERLLEGLGVRAAFIPARLEEGYLHPGVAAAVQVAGGNGSPGRLGVVGEVHPATRERFGIERACFAFELNLDLFPDAPPVQYRPVPRFPAILRDISFFVDDFVPAARVRGLIEEGQPEILEEIRVVEDYREEGKVPRGKKGMLWRLTYRAPGRTLTDAEVDPVHEALVQRLTTALRAERR